MIQQLKAGEFDLLNKCVDASVIQEGLRLSDQGIEAANYTRLGYGFCTFACEQGPQQFTAVRQAIAYCVDTEAFVVSIYKALVCRCMVITVWGNG